MSNIPKKTLEQILADHDGHPVFVYFNLHKKCWSVKSRKTGKVLCHADTVHLTGVTGKISEAGRQRVIREKRKNVHAGLTGTIGKTQTTETCRTITYNPYKYDSFVYRDNQEKYKGSGYAELHGRNVLVF